jgi:hypothetical protein
MPTGHASYGTLEAEVVLFGGRGVGFRAGVDGETGGGPAGDLPEPIPALWDEQPADPPRILLLT